MAFTLLINPGSSSKKYSLVSAGRVISSDRFERVGATFEVCTEQDGQQQKCEGVSGEDFSTSLRQVLDRYLRTNVIENLQDITTVGVRLVAPGTYFQSHRVIDDVFIHKLREREPAAPLHIPHTLSEIEVVRAELPHATFVAVSDSAFHASMPTQARDYSIESSDTESFDIHRFGYHGLSVASVVRRFRELRGELPARVIVCHIGSGVSMTAVKNGVSIDTTMGFGPDSGLVMGTRAGDLDAGALLELMRVKNIRSFDTLSYIQTRGGLRGLSGEADFRFILERAATEDEKAVAALTHFTHNFHKELGALQMVLGGVDAIILTATAAERSASLRQILFASLAWFGINFDSVKNESLLSQDSMITTNDSPIAVMVIRTREIEEMYRVTTSFVA
jgi:acetate kinase